jgi:hypothetical protein
MNKYITLCALFLATLWACKKGDHNFDTILPDSGLLPKNQFRYSGNDYSQHIPIDSANRMIGSYLTSIGYPSVDTGIRHMIFNADTMRNFLENNQIATLKFSMAHKRGSISGDNYGSYHGVNSNFFGLLLSGLNEEEDEHIYGPGNKVYDLSTSLHMGKDSANYLIGSYLTSIDYQNNQVDLRSLTFDADTIRSFLTNSNVVNLKFMFAHRDTYVNSDYYGVNCYLKAEGITFVIIGLDAYNEVVYTSNEMVLEHSLGCPYLCGSSSTFFN